MLHADFTHPSKNLKLEPDGGVCRVLDQSEVSGRKLLRT